MRYWKLLHLRDNRGILPIIKSLLEPRIEISLILVFYLDTPTGLYKSNAISVVLFNSSSNCENIGVENNIIRVESDSLDQQFIRPLTDFNFAIRISCL